VFVAPECLCEESTVFKNMDSRLKISGMTEGVDFRLYFGSDRTMRGKKTPLISSPLPISFSEHYRRFSKQINGQKGITTNYLGD